MKISFKPSIILKNRHLQTIIPAFTPIKNNLKKSEEVVMVKLEDGDSLVTKLNRRVDSNKVVFLIHGLEGSSEARYMLRTADRFLQEGYSTIRINLRNCGGSETLSQKLYHAGMAEDLDAVITAYCKQGFDWQEIYLLGFSLGGNIVGKYVGEKKDLINPLIKKAILVCPPLDLNKTMLKMRKGLNRIYDLRFTRMLRATYKRKCLSHPHIYQKKNLSKITNLKAFDDHITSQVFGFKNADDYYAKESSMNFIRDARIPVTILQAEDDPIIDVDEHKKIQALNLERVKVILVKQGGHVGFWGKGNGNRKAKYWLAETLLAILSNTTSASSFDKR